MTLKEIKFKRGYGVGFQSTLTSKEKLRHMREKKHNPNGGQLFIGECVHIRKDASQTNVEAA